ncbi:hypothetical protein MRB53_007784 [Persea americana]|uniref:Uncharacterized protein n=1 Tax=Persea americana TaxID=3435 RepID=A0ACC2MKB5_PERAE|nr:hypothetical protein MRB53_007784 [Persea americana]
MMQGHSPVSQPPPPIPDALCLNHPPESTTQPAVPIMASEALDILKEAFVVHYRLQETICVQQCWLDNTSSSKAVSL